MERQPVMTLAEYSMLFSAVETISKVDGVQNDITRRIFPDGSSTLTNNEGITILTIHASFRPFLNTIDLEASFARKFDDLVAHNYIGKPATEAHSIALLTKNRNTFSNVFRESCLQVSSNVIRRDKVYRYEFPSGASIIETNDDWSFGVHCSRLTQISLNEQDTEKTGNDPAFIGIEWGYHGMTEHDAYPREWGSKSDGTSIIITKLIKGARQ